MSKVRAHIFILGRVQGVFFRKETRQKAQEFDVRGFVKNLEDGKVETVLEGEKEKVEKVIEWLKRGPFLAKVNSLELKWEKHQGEFSNFEIKY